jgi:hypothetical protein
LYWDNDSVAHHCKPASRIDQRAASNIAHAKSDTSLRFSSTNVS